MKILAGSLLTIALGLTSGLANAQEIAGGSDGVWTNVWGAESMRISGPRGLAVEVAGTTYKGTLPDGSYRYEIYGGIKLNEDPYDSKMNINQGRDSNLSASARKYRAVGVIASGHFNIEGGAVLGDMGVREAEYGDSDG